jgi:hypothetical protein
VQTLGGPLQSVLVVQVVLQAPALQAYGTQDIVAGVTHIPLALQVAAAVRVDVVGQVAAMQVVPAAYRRQAPLPLQEPSVPHVATPWSAHWLRGSCPAGTDEQVPIDPVNAHDTQIPVEQAVEQQTPCSQKFELHIAGDVHAAPLGSLPQLMLTQLFGDTQSVAVLVQVVLQAVALAHWYGSHSVLVTERQTPAPSQVRCGVSVDPTQVPAAHCVLAAQ